MNRFGKVDEGTTVTDYDEEAIARKHTLAASAAYLEWSKQKINVIDTPGMGNFLTDAKAALRVDSEVRRTRSHEGKEAFYGATRRAGEARMWAGEVVRYNRNCLFEEPRRSGVRAPACQRSL